MNHLMNRLLGGPRALLASLSGALILTALIAACGGGEPEEVTFNLEIKNGALVREDTTLEVKQDDKITIELKSDEMANYHLHGYDLEGMVGPDMPATIAFDAYATGSFPFTIHPGSGGHSHGAGEEQCKVEPAAGEPMPQISVSAIPSDQPHLVDVAVETQNIELSPNGDHWHLEVNGQSVGMYANPQVTFDTRRYESSGEYEIMVSLNNAQHCDYGIQAMTTVTMQDAGSATGTMSMDAMSGMGDMKMEQPEEIELGRLVVQPR